MNAFSMDSGSDARMKLLLPMRIIARPDEKETFVGGTALTGKAVGWKPTIQKQSGHMQNICLFFSTVDGGGSAGGEPGFFTRWAIKGVNSQGRATEEEISVTAQSAEGDSLGDPFRSYMTKTMWSWVHSLELLEYETGGGAIDGFSMGHMIANKKVAPDTVTIHFFDDTGTSYDIGRDLEIDRILMLNQYQNTYTDLPAQYWTYTPADGRLLVKVPNGVWIDGQDLFIIKHPARGR